MDFIAVIVIIVLLLLSFWERGYEKHQKQKNASWELSKNKLLFKKILNALVIIAIIWLLISIFMFIGHPERM